MLVRNDPRVTTKTGFYDQQLQKFSPQNKFEFDPTHPKRQLSPPSLVAPALVIWLDFDDSDVSTPSQQNVFDITSFRDVPKMK